MCSPWNRKKGWFFLQQNLVLAKNRGCFPPENQWKGVYFQCEEGAIKQKESDAQACGSQEHQWQETFCHDMRAEGLNPAWVWVYTWVSVNAV